MSPVTFQAYLVLLLGACCALGVVVVGLRRPWWATVAAIVSIPALPVWLGTGVGPFFLTSHFLLALLAICAMLRVTETLPRLVPVDVVIVGLPLLAMAMTATGNTNLNQVFVQVQWLTAYAFGRLALRTWDRRLVLTVVAVAFTLAAVAMLIEALTAENLWIRFLGMGNSLFSVWGTQQFRAGEVRTEGAFGHSIAAGVSLSIAAVLTLDARLPQWARLACSATMALGVLTTLSRISMITAALGLVLAASVAHTSLTRRARMSVLAVAAAGSLVYLWRFSAVLERSGDEGENSALYRTWILDLLPTLKPLGFASSYSRTSAGTNTYGAFRSIDNAFLVFGLANGWIPMLALAGLLVVALIHVLRGRAGVAGAALAAQTPALFSVALITQYSALFWMTAGFAVSEALARAIDTRAEHAVGQTAHSGEPVAGARAARRGTRAAPTPTSDPAPTPTPTPTPDPSAAWAPSVVRVPASTPAPTGGSPC